MAHFTRMLLMGCLGILISSTCCLQAGIFTKEPMMSLVGHQYFLDTADVYQWEKYYKMGIFHGITTNPVLLERAHVSCNLNNLKALSKIAIDDFAVECFMLQTWGDSVANLINVGLDLASISEKIVVKVPLTPMGVEAAAQLKKRGVPICMTACYTPHQVFTSVGLNADYVAPYVGRMMDMGKDAMSDVIQMQRIVDSLRSKTRVFVASIRSPDQLATLAAAGCNTFTFSPAIAQDLLDVPESIAATKDFETAVRTSLKYPDIQQS